MADLAGPGNPACYRENEEFEGRKIKHVSLVEIGNAMAELCRNAAGLEPEELKKQTIRVFEGKRLTAGIGQHLEDALTAALDAGEIAMSGTVLVRHKPNI